MNSQQLQTLPPNWEEEAKKYLHNNNYVQAAQLYEQAIEAEPEIKSHYWHLGLILLLKGEEVEAQTIWLLAMADGEPDEIEAWTSDLIQVLETAAEHYRLEIGDYVKAWVIRQHIRELQPDNINNLLHLVGLSTLRQTYTEEEVIELGIIDILKSKTELDVDSLLLLQIVNNILDQSPFKRLSYDFAEAVIPHIKGNEDDSVLQCLIPLIYKLAYSAKNYPLALSFTQQGLKSYPEYPELLLCCASFYQDLCEFSEGIETAKLYYSVVTTLADQVYANHILMRGLMSLGAYGDELDFAQARHKALIQSLIEEQPLDLPTGVTARLFSSAFFFPYLQDQPEENLLIRHQLAKLAQTNTESSFKETVAQCRQWQSRVLSPQPLGKKLKIGYLSHCLLNHSVGWLARWLFQYHDHENFEIYAYMLGAELYQNDLKRWYMSKVDKAYQLGLDDVSAAEKIAEDEIDILIDLDSITLTNSCQNLALKPAPIQATWLGWDSSCIPAIDYFIADPYVLPDDAENYYPQKIMRLPHTYLAINGFEVAVPDIRRDMLGIPNDAIIYFTAQRGYKYNAHTARLQMQILSAVPNSYFIIKGVADQESLKQFYGDIAGSEGVNPDRLKTLPLSPTEAIHRANLAIADVVLDTYPYNGATTTMETLWMGIPMVTRVGQQFAARNSYTMMINAGITEGIAWTDEEYVEWGVKLGTDENLRQQVAWKLRKNRQTAPLWNAKQFTHEMENAYQQMWKNYIEDKH
ncbi:MAG: O-linked N-acetylglucosamine transferase, SPINDLY family protein [Planktothrix sp.]|uniref:O-linked N-acetylglucosamine transferase, SPINDLY family protein n=1 Tax=Planktothrix sp. TaxID=3088171 RepID=UPI0038D3E17B